ncbi:MAG: hypothetical protein PVG65_02715 [Candidatus Thorarchaeota archaeon]|jgi:hypothetical protein
MQIVTVNKEHYDNLLEISRRYDEIKNGIDPLLDSLKNDIHDLFRENLELRKQLGAQPSISEKLLDVLDHEW